MEFIKTFFLDDHLWYTMAGLASLLLFIFIFLLWDDKQKRNSPKAKKRIHEYVYYGIDRTIDSKRRYVLLTLIDSKGTKYEKVKLANIISSPVINLNKLHKTDKKGANRFIDIMDSKVIVESYPVYMVLEILKEDLPLLDTQPNLHERYVQELRNLVFYSKHAFEVKHFIENR